MVHAVWQHHDVTPTLQKSMFQRQATTPGAAFLSDSSSSTQAAQQAAAAAAAKLNRARNRKAAVASGALSSTVQTALGALQVGRCCHTDVRSVSFHTDPGHLPPGNTNILRQGCLCQ